MILILAFLALKGGDWEEYKCIFRTEVKATGWAFDRIKEGFDQVAKDEARKLSTAQENPDKKYRLLAGQYRASREAMRRYDVILVPAL